MLLNTASKSQFLNLFLKMGISLPMILEQMVRVSLYVPYKVSETVDAGPYEAGVLKFRLKHSDRKYWKKRFSTKTVVITLDFYANGGFDPRPGQKSL